MGGGTVTNRHVTEMNLTQGGIYYLRYHAGDGVSTTPYQFATSLRPASDPFEPNNSFEMAKQIPASDAWFSACQWNSTGSSMNIGWDEDYYYFLAADAGQYAITLQGWTGIFDWGRQSSMSVYNAKQEPVAGDPLANFLGAAPIAFSVPSAGKYYVRLHSGEAASVDGYQFKLTGSILTVPELRIDRQSSSQLRVSWPISAANWTLQKAGDLRGSWRAAEEAVQTDSRENFVLVAPQAGGAWYRLER